MLEPDVRWFAWWEVGEALAYGRAGHIALHYFRYDLRRFGLGMRDPCCHVMSADRALLTAFVGQFGMPEFLIRPPRRHRPDVWHFDAFSWVLDAIQRQYPLPPEVEAATHA